VTFDEDAEITTEQTIAELAISSSFDARPWLLS